jgi:regulator of protease activity HflC (stomatin/prohibitin superfamily)
MNEKSIQPKSGALALVVVFILLAISIGTAILELYFIAPVALVLAILCLIGLVVVNPNESVVAVLFGSYAGTLKENGFFWMNPFYIKRRISLRARNNESLPIKVNDKLGNPIMIGIVLVWRVENTFKAAFDVDNYELFVKIQSESAIRKLAGIYPYDSFDDDHSDISLRSGGDEINHQLEKELSERLQMAGISVIEARISNLAYSQEIAGAMLQRQQATAIVAARTRIVEGAVGMVELALHQLSAKKIIELDDERKAAMVSNLLVVLCSERSATPIVNAGTLNN